MSSVTQRIKEIKQPYGGFIKPSNFVIKELTDNNQLNNDENIHPSLIGLVVDYLTRYLLTKDKEQSFHISLYGAEIATFEYSTDSSEKAYSFLYLINGLDDISIINACKLVTFDVWVRNISSAFFAKKAEEINPNKNTIQNIKIMVERSIKFFKTYGPIIKSELTFEPNGYTSVVSSGDGDFLTEDTFWDFKVSKSKLNSKQTLQLLMYYIMGQHSGQEIYKNIKKIGFFNPRLNKIYILNVNEIPKETIETIEKEIICYK